MINDVSFKAGRSGRDLADDLASSKGGHEADHLDGKLYIDRLPARERKRIMKELEESRAAAG